MGQAMRTGEMIAPLLPIRAQIVALTGALVPPSCTGEGNEVAVGNGVSGLRLRTLRIEASLVHRRGAFGSDPSAGITPVVTQPLPDLLLGNYSLAICRRDSQ